MLKRVVVVALGCALVAVLAVGCGGGAAPNAAASECAPRTPFVDVRSDRFVPALEMLSVDGAVAIYGLAVVDTPAGHTYGLSYYHYSVPGDRVPGTAIAHDEVLHLDGLDADARMRRSADGSWSAILALPGGGELRVDARDFNTDRGALEALLRSLVLTDGHAWWRRFGSESLPVLAGQPQGTRVVSTKWTPLVITQYVVVPSGEVSVMIGRPPEGKPWPDGSAGRVAGQPAQGADGSLAWRIEAGGNSAVAVAHGVRDDARRALESLTAVDARADIASVICANDSVSRPTR